MEVKIKKYHNDARIPSQFYDKDFCYDCYATSIEEIAPNVYKYGLGFGLQIQRDEELIDDDVKISIDIRPRSSIYKTGMILSNSVGTIDEGYCNEIFVIFYHMINNLPKYEVGDRICQMKIGATLPIEFIEVDSFLQTERSMNGFGSSGR